MKLAVFSGQYFWFDGKSYSTDEAFVKFVTSFYPYFEKVVFCDAVTKDNETQYYVLDSEKTEVWPLPFFSVYSFWKNLLVIYPRIYCLVDRIVKEWDLVWLPGPHPVGLIIALICIRRRRPFFQVIRANLKEQVRHRNRGIKKQCAMTVAAVLEYVSKRLSRKHLTFTVGEEMFDAYRKDGFKVHKMAVSLVSEEVIEHSLQRGSREFHSPVRLLSVGRLDPEKGLVFLVEAVEKLVKEMQLSVILRIAGKGINQEEEKRLREEVEKRQLEEYIRFVGYEPHGPKLFELYRESDIFVLPSLSGEGFPQTLFEAMACGTPIIATRVAGISGLIEREGCGVLVSPGSSKEISETIEHLVADPKLRQRLIRNGVSFVKKHTLEAERDRMLSRIQETFSLAKSCPS